MIVKIFNIYMTWPDEWDEMPYYWDRIPKTLYRSRWSSLSDWAVRKWVGAGRGPRWLGVWEKP